MVDQGSRLKRMAGNLSSMKSAPAETKGVPTINHARDADAEAGVGRGRPTCYRHGT